MIIDGQLNVNELISIYLKGGAKEGESKSKSLALKNWWNFDILPFRNILYHEDLFAFIYINLEHLQIGCHLLDFP